VSATNLYGRHREGDCSDRCPLCAEQERAERDTGHVCSGYCDTGLTVLSARAGWVCFQVGDGPECIASVQDLADAEAAFAEFEAPEFATVLVDGQPLDESDVDLLLSVARSQETATTALRGTSA